MVVILLTVLKIVGITLLVILGLILCILLLVLFVPVRYRGRGSYLEQQPCVALRASWLLHMISVRGEYQKEQALHLYLKLFGITIYDNLKISDKKTKNKKAKSTKNKEEKRTGEIQAASAAVLDADESKIKHNDSSAENDVFTEAVESTHDDVHEDGSVESESDTNERGFTEAGESLSEAAQTDIAKAMDNDSAGESDFTGKKVGIVKKIKNFFIKFVNFFKNIKFTFDRVCDTISKIKDNIRYYLKVLQLDSTRRAFASCQTQLMRILKKISPRKYRINLHLGFEDPAVMGEVLAVWGMLYPIHQGNIDVQPEFEKSVIEGDFSFQGCVSVFVFVRAVCILFFDKDVKHLIRHLRHNEA